MRSGTNNASQETSWSFRGKVRLAFVGALVVLMAGLCLATLSGCSILPAHALGGSAVKDSQVEQSVQAVGGNSSDLSQAYQGVCQKCSDVNNDGICDNCGNDYRGVCQKFSDTNNDGLCDNCGTLVRATPIVLRIMSMKTIMAFATIANISTKIIVL